MRILLCFHRQIWHFERKKKKKKKTQRKNEMHWFMWRKKKRSFGRLVHTPVIGSQMSRFSQGCQAFTARRRTTNAIQLYRSCISSLYFVHFGTLIFFPLFFSFSSSLNVYIPTRRIEWSLGQQPRTQPAPTRSSSSPTLVSKNVCQSISLLVR
jgi:hypothetical protein